MRLTSTSAARGAAPAPDPLAAYWSLPAAELLARLDAPATGLSSDEAARRQERYGPNGIGARAAAGPLRLFLRQLSSPIVLLLLFATIVSAVLQDWVDAGLICAIVLISAGLSFVQEYQASGAVQRLQQRVQARVTALRDGKPASILAAEVVPGDVLLLSAGALIPADGVLLEQNELAVNQAALTGETFPATKQVEPSPAGAGLAERQNCVFGGTSVISGAGTLLVAQTGAATALGQIAGRLAMRPPETDFERGVRRLGTLLSEVTLLLVLAVFAVNVFFARPVLDSLLFALALAVGLTPQLLPAIINVNLSRGARAMASAGVIVRRLSSIENFGAMDVLCTDKTGTLTVGVVTLDGALGPGGEPDPAVARAALLNAALQTGMANPLDQAVVAALHAPRDGVTKQAEIPYDFQRKRLGVVAREGAARTLIVKGALEPVLAVCDRVAAAGAPAPLDDAGRQALLARFSAWSEQGYRVLGVASREVADQPAYTPDDERGLCFLGFLRFLDPLKPGVEAAVADLRGLGVGLKMITGDNRLVAAHVGAQLGLDPARALAGAQIGALSADALRAAAESTDIFAEVDPSQKERIIAALRQRGHVVGYMGDGINDASALYAADVGLSVDSAVDVAKDAADFVLLQNDLGVLHRGIVEGRRTFANTLKYVFMATSANFGNMFSVAGASLFLPFLPMLPKQILLINTLSDLPEMTIAGDNVDADTLAKPQRWDLGFIRRFMISFGLLSSVFDYVTFAVLYLALRSSPELFHTGWFVESVWSAGLVVFAIRTRRPIAQGRPSRALIAVTAVVLLAVLALPYTPLAGPLGFVPLGVSTLLLILAIVLTYVVAAELLKRWFYRQT
jgi:Mg2+-importing ATPase